MAYPELKIHGSTLLVKMRSLVLEYALIVESMTSSIMDPIRSDPLREDGNKEREYTLISLFIYLTWRD